MDKQTMWVVGGGVLVVAIAIGLFYKAPSPVTNSGTTRVTVNNDNDTMQNENMPKVTDTATLKTNMGDITVSLYGKAAPKTVANFLKLARSNFYDGVKFHRVIKGFMDQTGDPNSKDDTKVAQWGMGGPGYRFEDEIDPSSALVRRGYKKGVLAMANAGPNTNGSQFFIMAADYPLQPNYTIFGEVTAGQDVVDAINNVATGANDRPVNPVVINSVIAK